MGHVGARWQAVGGRGSLVWTGEFDEGERYLQRAAQAVQSDTGPDVRLLLHLDAGIVEVCRGRYPEALAEFSAAEHLRSQLEGSHRRPVTPPLW
jgi:LuxR family maltose regulon positive regulatory protein